MGNAAWQGKCDRASRGGGGVWVGCAASMACGLVGEERCEALRRARARPTETVKMDSKWMNHPSYI
jgi:hypothetical protein